MRPRHVRSGESPTPPDRALPTPPERCESDAASLRAPVSSAHTRRHVVVIRGAAVYELATVKLTDPPRSGVSSSVTGSRSPPRRSPVITRRYPMPYSEIEDAAPQTQGIVERLVRETRSKRFLKAVGAPAPRLRRLRAGRLRQLEQLQLVFIVSSSAAPATSSPPPRARARAGAAISAILNYALTLEYLETQFYTKAGGADLFHGATLSLLKSFGEQEASHVQALMSAIKAPAALRWPSPRASSRSPARPRWRCSRTRREPRRRRLPRPGGQHPEQAGARRRTVDPHGRGASRRRARHAVKKSITPDGAFGKPADMTTVLTAVKPFLA